ncbi:hypothetical protein HDA36_000371 [Nocardiopsis composta]|uniref:Uncharacterized protein n=1 Tax=Nocardiopsis composta TaxID=157465 RepID=A0A7W8VBM5_9ACTN|nr:hypothetical protein [Nocardiopsis composta]
MRVPDGTGPGGPVRPSDGREQAVRAVPGPAGPSSPNGAAPSGGGYAPIPDLSRRAGPRSENTAFAAVRGHGPRGAPPCLPGEDTRPGPAERPRCCGLPGPGRCAGQRASAPDPAGAGRSACSSRPGGAGPRGGRRAPARDAPRRVDHRPGPGVSATVRRGGAHTGRAVARSGPPWAAAGAVLPARPGRRRRSERVREGGAR